MFSGFCFVPNAALVPAVFTLQKGSCLDTGVHGEMI